VPGSWEAFSSGAGLPLLARHLYPDRAWPTDVTATGISASEIRLTWTRIVGDVTGYRIRRWDGTVFAVVVDALAADQSTYSDAGLASGMTYNYAVCAYGPGGEACANNVPGTTR
jgi:hypothetical protein